MMKPWQFFTVLLLAFACVGVSVASVLVARANSHLQAELQERQVRLNNGLLSQKGQQIASNILQEMAQYSVTNKPIRALLNKHGYNVEPNKATVTPPSTAQAKPATPAAPAASAEPVEEVNAQ
ncbi:MAG: hypothetical protein O3C57_03290 [Verrucomicrobia bacterium]|nr:hypothetical protein [Verrucomicrobiota bacterium]